MFLFSAPQIGSFKVLERPHGSSGVFNLSQRRALMRRVNAEPQRKDSVVPLAATIVAPGTCFLLTMSFLVFREIFYFLKVFC